MNQPDSELPAPIESRVDQMERIALALTDFERDELRIRLLAIHLKEHCQRMSEPRNAFALGLHTFVFSGGVFGLTAGTVMGLVVTIGSGPLQGLLWFAGAALLGGAAFGLLMSLMIVFALQSQFKRLGKNLVANKSALFLMEELVLPLSAEQAFNVCLTEVEARKGWRMESVDKKDRAISVATTATFRSPGELVGVNIDFLSMERSRVRIYSRALLTTTDFGKNRWNVRTLADSIKKHGEAVALIADYKTEPSES